MRKKISVTGLQKAAIGTVVAGVMAGTLWLTFGKGMPFQVPAYSVSRVIDGDTFETVEKQLIRLASTEAPEVGLCGSQEAKNALEGFVMGKPVYLKVLYRDPYYRLVSQVYTKDGYVNERMIAEGFAYYYNRDKNVAEKLKSAGEQARKEKKGIHGPPCTQTNPTTPGCEIKGNVREEKIYFTPECQQYKITDVQLYLGDRWFCTEREAFEAGFRKGKQCP